MSSVLEAARELERGKDRGVARKAPWCDAAGSTGRLLAGVMVTSVLVAGADFMLGGRTASLVVTQGSTAAPAAVADASASLDTRETVPLPAAALAPALPPAFVRADPPWGRVLAVAPGPGAVPGTPWRSSSSSQARSRDESDPGGREPSTGQVSMRARAPRPSADQGIRLLSLRYSVAPGDRAVTLGLPGGKVATLREGESGSDVEVQLILPDRVYLRQGGTVFALGG
jgi:hypothetical protein